LTYQVRLAFFLIILSDKTLTLKNNSKPGWSEETADISFARESVKLLYVYF
jgi:hypothetical protein